MKLSLFPLILIFLSAGSVVHAGNAGGMAKASSHLSLESVEVPGKMARKGPVLRLQVQLGLSVEQVEAIKKIRSDGGSREQVLAVLSQEQRDQFKELQQKKRAVKANKADFVSRMESKLDLSGEQVETMRQIQADGGDRAEIRAVLTEEQRAKLMDMRKDRQRSEKKKGAREQESQA